MLSFSDKKYENKKLKLTVNILENTVFL